jgi:hypothetical protein
MNTKRVGVFLLFALFFCASRGVSQFEEAPDGLALLWTTATAGEPSSEFQNIVITMAVKNVSDSNIVILTENLQDDLWMYKEKPWELHLDLSAFQKENDTILIPLLSTYAPVTVKPKEVTTIRHVYKDRKHVKEAVIVFDMCNPVCDRYHTWSGRLRSKLLLFKGTGE